MKHPIRNLFLFLLILIIAAVVALVLWLDTLIVKGVETYAPPITKTEVELGAVHTSLLNGSVSLHDFRLGPPKGFKSDTFSFDTVSVVVDVPSVLKDTIIVKEVKISGVHATAEITAKGVNINALLKNLEASTKSSGNKKAAEPKKEPAKTSSAPAKKVIIKKVIFEKGVLTLSLFGVPADVPLPDVVMTDIGANKKSYVQVVTEVLVRYCKEVASVLNTAKDNLLKGGSELVGKSIDQAQGVVNDTVNKAQEGVNKTLDKAQEGIAKGLDKTQEGIAKGVGAVTDSIGSLFGK